MQSMVVLSVPAVEVLLTVAGINMSKVRGVVVVVGYLVVTAKREVSHEFAEHSYRYTEEPVYSIK